MAKQFNSNKPMMEVTVVSLCLAFFIVQAAGMSIPEGTVECTETTFSCKADNTKCVAPEKRCDGIPDCSDSSDEQECAGQCSGPEKFLCPDGLCLKATAVCNGQKECTDGHDESNCTAAEQPPSDEVTSSGEEKDDLNAAIEAALLKKGNCSENEFTCRDKTCISRSLVCDKNNDCKDGSDETLGCTNNLTCKDGFRCDAIRCLPLEWVCDGTEDCDSGVDERNCPASRPSRNVDNIDEKECLKSADEEKCILMKAHRYQLKGLKLQWERAEEQLEAARQAAEASNDLAKQRLETARVEQEAAKEHLALQKELYNLKIEAIRPKTGEPPAPAAAAE